jgi:hypothetical protein
LRVILRSPDLGCESLVLCHGSRGAARDIRACVDLCRKVEVPATVTCVAGHDGRRGDYILPFNLSGHAWPGASTRPGALPLPGAWSRCEPRRPGRPARPSRPICGVDPASAKTFTPHKGAKLFIKPGSTATISGSWNVRADRATDEAPVLDEPLPDQGTDPPRLNGRLYTSDLLAGHGSGAATNLRYRRSAPEGTSGRDGTGHEGCRVRIQAAIRLTTFG